MNGKMVVSKPLYVALAQRKEDRRARLQVCFLDDFFEPSNNCSGTGVSCLQKSNQHNYDFLQSSCINFYRIFICFSLEGC